MPIIQVVGAAIIHRGLCLATRRGPAMALPGKWEFPGGKVEPGESPEQALAREIEEELQISIRVGNLLGTGTGIVGTKTIQLDVYASETHETTPTLTEHSEYRWLTARELPHLDWAEADIPVLPAVIAWMDSLSQSISP